MGTQPQSDSSVNSGHGRNFRQVAPCGRRGTGPGEVLGDVTEARGPLKRTLETNISGHVPAPHLSLRQPARWARTTWLSDRRNRACRHLWRPEKPALAPAPNLGRRIKHGLPLQGQPRVSHEARWPEQRLGPAPLYSLRQQSAHLTRGHARATPGPPAVFIKFCWNTPRSFIQYTGSMAASTLSRQSRVVRTETLWPMKLKIPTVRPLQE